MRIKRNQKTRIITDFHSITSFQQKISENLASISVTPNDEFTLIGYNHNYKEFTCELCGHQHCVREFIVQNIKTESKMSIGSECINHFQDKGIDIDLAFGLMKRVENITSESRNYAKKRLGADKWITLSLEEKKKLYMWYKPNEEYVPDIVLEDLGKAEFKKLSKKEKNDITINAYMAFQVKELIRDMKFRDAVLTEKQVEDIIKLGFLDELKEAQNFMKKYK